MKVETSLTQRIDPAAAQRLWQLLFSPDPKPDEQPEGDPVESQDG